MKRNGPPKRAVPGVLQGGENWGTGGGSSPQARIAPISPGCFRLIRCLTGEQLANRCRIVGTYPPCEHVFGLTSKGSITGQLQRAIAKRDLLAVRSLAGEMSSVPLSLAAEITVLLLEREPESFVPAARRLVARLAEERTMPLRQLAEVASFLADLEASPVPIASSKALVSLVEAAPSA
jgi:hypothetical protein